MQLFAYAGGLLEQPSRIRDPNNCREGSGLVQTHSSRTFSESTLSGCSVVATAAVRRLLFRWKVEGFAQEGALHLDRDTRPLDFSRVGVRGAKFGSS